MTLDLQSLQGVDGHSVTFAQVFGVQYDEFRSYLSDAQYLLDAGLAERATSLLEALVVLNPRSFGALLSLGLAYERTNRSTEALRAFEQAAALDARSAAARAGVERNSRR